MSTNNDGVQPNDYERLSIICDRDCTCPKFVQSDRKTWNRCDRCNAAGILNDFGETVREYFAELAARTKETTQ